MGFLLLLLGSIALLALAYRVYGRLLSRWMEVSDANQVPSKTIEDGVDFVPTSPFVVFGHHFSSIAGAGPVVGPVIAAMYFGWLPALCWILLGSIFIGGAHDFGSMMASLRHRAGSVAEVGRLYMSSFGGRLFMIFIWLALVYVVIVFLDLTAVTFVQDGGVASSSGMLVGLALACGWVLTRWRLGAVRTMLLFLPLVGLCVWAGGEFPIVAVPELLGSQKNTWSILLVVYSLMASVAPVWLLLQPRDFLSSFLLYFAVIGGVVGLAAGAALGEIAMQWPGTVQPAAVEALGVTHIGPWFPILFITVACGACSGFHSIVSSGTTARQIRRESDARRIGYGGMLIEAFVAVVSLATVMMIPFSADPFRSNPMIVYGQGMGQFLAVFGVAPAVGAHLAMLAVSTFLLTTLDTCVRLGRFVLQELFGWENGRIWTRYASTLLTLAAPAWLAFLTFTDAKGNVVPMWQAIWPVFGATNQLLGALALLAVTIWLKRVGRVYLFAAIPMVFMLVMTLTALVKMVMLNRLNLIGGFAAALVVMGAMIAWEAFRALRAPAANHETVVAAAAAAAG